MPRSENCNRREIILHNFNIQWREINCSFCEEQKQMLEANSDVDCLEVCCLKPKVGSGNLLIDTPTHLPDVSLTVCSCHVTYAFQSESTLYSCLNVKELLAQSRCKIWSLTDCNWTGTHNHLVRKQTLNHLTKLAK